MKYLKNIALLFLNLSLIFSLFVACSTPNEKKSAESNRELSAESGNALEDSGDTSSKGLESGEVQSISSSNISSDNSASGDNKLNGTKSKDNSSGNSNQSSSEISSSDTSETDGSSSNSTLGSSDNVIYLPEVP